jgi:hypothetical protein
MDWGPRDRDQHAEYICRREEKEVGMGRRRDQAVIQFGMTVWANPQWSQEALWD